MYTIENDSHVSSEDGVEKGQCYHLVKRSNCLNSLVNSVFENMKKPNQAPELKTTEKVLELLQPTRYKPSTVDEMAQETKFTREEVKFLYRAFKQECPNGIIDEDTFKEVYAKIFPLGDATKYAHLVFTAIDREKTGGITFGDFMDFLSIISKGSPKEKILWSFHFYDVNRDGQISKEEMVKVTESIYDLMGSESPSSHRMDEIFSNMDSNRDGVVSPEEFYHYCSTSSSVSQSLCVLP